VRFGLKANQNGLDWPEILSRVRFAEAAGFEGAFIFDHFQIGDPPESCMESWSLLAALAATTERIRLGALVSGVTFRHPSLLAAQAVTVDQISGGRLDIAMGAAWNAAEHRQLGLDFPNDRERSERLEEAVQVLRLVMTTDEATFDGRYYSLRDLTYRPRPVQQPHPPIWIGAGGERLTIPIAARYADVWHCFSPVAELPAKVALFERHARDAGRDPASIGRAATIELDGPTHAAAESIEQLRALGFGYIVVQWPESGRKRVDEFVDTVMRDAAGD
jgi:F420-dependent oxidoreductase-like protein